MVLQEHMSSNLADDAMKTDESDTRDIAQQPRRVRKKSRWKELGSRDDSAIMPPSKTRGHGRSTTRANTKSESARLSANLSGPQLLQSTCMHGAELIEQRPTEQELEGQRALWESMLLKSLLNHIEFTRSRLHIDHVHLRHALNSNWNLVCLDDGSFFSEDSHGLFYREIDHRT